MIKFDLSTMVPNPKHAEIKLPPIHDSPGLRRSYLAELRRMLKEIAAYVRQYILPLYKRDIAMLDVAPHEFSGLDALVARLSAIASNTITGLLNVESKRHTDQFNRSVKRSLGIDLLSVLRQEDLQDYMNIAATRNAALISDLGSDTLKRIKVTVTNNLMNAKGVNELTSDLKTQFGFLDNRAKLIAADQTSKFNSDLNKIRHEQAGVEEYDWLTSHDERVRSLHKSLDGVRYDYDESTGAEDGLRPGQPIRCRCVAIGVVSFVSQLAKIEKEAA